MTYNNLKVELRSEETRPRRKRIRPGCWTFLQLGLFLGILVAVYLFAPFRTNILLLGIDRTLEETDLGRSDTMILLTVQPLKPYVGMLSIPRDLWVEVPEVGENRINSAHFFAEAEKEGSGPKAASETVTRNFGVEVDYTVSILLENFPAVIDALGGVDLYLPQPMAGYSAGDHHFDGEQSLAFVRNREGTDFARMDQGQLLLKSLWSQALKVESWSHFPEALSALGEAVDTNIPFWQWPRLLFALLRAGPEGIDNRTVPEDMVTPHVTEDGAQVLLPDWVAINTLMLDMFER